MTTAEIVKNIYETVTVLGPVLLYEFFLKLKPIIWLKFWPLHSFFYQCGDNDTSVATFVATIIKTLDTAGLNDNTTEALY